MSIKLFEHNQSAFGAVLDMLAETGKAAVVHPTAPASRISASSCASSSPTRPFAGFIV